MRLKITIRPERPDIALPINYQYQLSSAIYSTLTKAAPDYAAFLHDEGYASSTNRRMKLFCFSRLFSDRKPILQNGHLRWYGKPRIWFFLGSALEETFVRNAVLGFFRADHITLADGMDVRRFRVEGVDIVAMPDWDGVVRAICLSPMTVSLQDQETRRIAYLHPDDFRFTDAVAQNLLRKHEILHGSFTEPHRCTFTPDRSYIDSRGGSDRVSKLITIKEGHADETRVRGFLFPFEMTADAPLLATAWDCGIGEKNSLGFGMWDARTNDMQHEGEEHDRP